MHKALCLIFLISFNAHSFLGAGGSVGAVFDLVTTTASQLNELEKLVSSAQTYTKQMNQYNQLVRDEYFRAQRVLYLSEQVAKKRQVQNLGNLNRAIRELKSNMKNLEYVMEKYSIVQAKEVQTHQEVELEKKLNTHKQEIAKSQLEESVNASTQSRSNQLTAQNTALIYESQVGMHNSHLEVLKNTATTNRLMAEKMERERIKEMGLRRSYGMRISNE